MFHSAIYCDSFFLNDNVDGGNDEDDVDDNVVDEDVLMVMVMIMVMIMVKMRIVMMMMMMHDDVDNDNDGKGQLLTTFSFGRHFQRYLCFT